MWPLGRVQATSFGLWDKKKGISLTAWARFVKYCSDAICIDILRVSLMGLLWPFHFAAAASLVVKVYPERVLASQGGSVTLRCQVSGSPPHYFYWSREDGRPISSGADRRRQGTSHTWCTYSSMISALFILVWSTVKKKFCSSWSEYTNCVYRYAYKITLQAWTRHLLFICVCAGAELYFPNVQSSDAGVYVCTCRDQRSTNRSRAEIVVTSVYRLTAV